jgi:hypothetical protein
MIGKLLLEVVGGRGVRRHTIKIESFLQQA